MKKETALSELIPRVRGWIMTKETEKNFLPFYKIKAMIVLKTEIKTLRYFLNHLLFLQSCYEPIIKSPAKDGMKEGR